MTVPPAPAPTGLIRFRLYNVAANPICDPAGTVHSTSVATTPVDHFGPPPYVSAPSNPIVLAGTYTWTATFESGDANYPDAGPTACLDPDETFTVGPATPSITTEVSAPTPLLGGTSTDTALLIAPPSVTVPPAPAPTGLIRFRLYEIAVNPTCDPAGTVHSTSVATTTVDHFGPPPYVSGPSDPIFAPGTYTWTATYESGADPNYSDAGPTACNDPAETFTVAPPTPEITTVVSAPTPLLGGTSTDTALLTAPVDVTVPPAPAPTGLIRFRLFNVAVNPTCDPAGTVHSTSVATTAVDHFGPPPYVSEPSDPITEVGTYTWTAVFESGDANYTDAGPSVCQDPAETFTVGPATPTITTQVELPPPGLGGTSTDTALLATPPGVTVPPAPAPTGLIRFRLYEIAVNPTCDPAGTVHSTSVATTTVDHFGPPPYVSAPSNPIVVAGTYTWTAVFESGDANYTDAGPTACNDPAETFTVGLATPTITTQVDLPPPVLGGTSTDRATLIAPPGITVPPAPAPTGLIRFRLYETAVNPTCDPAGAVHSTSVATTAVDHFGPPPYVSAPSNPITAVGTYTWTAEFESGDANYSDAGPTACNDPAETFTVGPVPPTITTVVSAPTPGFGGTSTDSANLIAPPGITVPPAPGPTGLIRFRLFNTAVNPACDPAGTVHSTSTTAVDHFGPPPYASEPSNPIVVAGTYTWTAVFESGDANYPDSAPTACLDPAETFTVVGQPQILVDKTADPLTRPAPGGTFTFTVVVTNPGPVDVTIDTLTDDIYGDLATRAGS
ncbi:MAG: hypothetical protein LC708_02220, partial [Actinobacteria bacterium]|nr:hypothetical protein [Actinomycetota bacterium]